MLEQTDPKASLKNYEVGLKIMQQDIDERINNGEVLQKEEQIIPPELHINVGTLRLEVGKV